MALYNICVQTSSGPHLICKVISFEYSADWLSCQGAILLQQQYTYLESDHLDLCVNLYPSHYSPLSLLALKNYIYDISIYIAFSIWVLSPICHQAFFCCSPNIVIRFPSSFFIQVTFPQYQVLYMFFCLCIIPPNIDDFPNNTIFFSINSFEFWGFKLPSRFRTSTVKFQHRYNICLVYATSFRQLQSVCPLSCYLYYLKGACFLMIQFREWSISRHILFVHYY